MKAQYEQEKQEVLWKDISDQIAKETKLKKSEIATILYIAMQASMEIFKDGLPVHLGKHFGFDIRLETYLKRVLKEKELAVKQKKRQQREKKPRIYSSVKHKTDGFNRSDFIVVRIKEGVLGLGYVEDIISDTEIQVNVVYSVFKKERFFIKLLPDCVSGTFEGNDFLSPQTGNKILNHILPQAFPATSYDTVRKTILDYQT